MAGRERGEVNRLLNACIEGNHLSLNVFHWAQSSLCVKICHALANPIVNCEAPDAYVHMGEEVLMIEHFAFDGSSKGKRGSLYQRRVARLYNELDWEHYALSSEMRIRKTEEPLKLKPVSQTLDAYLQSVSESFNRHLEQLPTYLANLVEKTGVRQENILKCFLMQDTSPLPPILLSKETREKRVFLPPFIPDCWDMFERSGLDCLLFAIHNGNSNELYYWECGDPRSRDYLIKPDEELLYDNIHIHPFAINAKLG